MISIIYNLAALLAVLASGFVLGVICLANDMETKAPDLYIEYRRRIRETRRCKNGKL